MTKLGDISTEMTAPDDDDLLYIWDASAAAGSRDAKIKVENLTKTITVAPGWHGIAGDGETDDTDAFNALIAALSDGDRVNILSGTYLIDTDIDCGEKHIVWMIDGNATFTGDGDFMGEKFAMPTATQGMTIHGKLVLRGETDNPLTHEGFTDADRMAVGQSLRIDNKSAPGTCMVFLSNNENLPVLVDPIYDDTLGVYVTLHSHTTQTTDVAKIWGINPIVVKSVTVAAASTGYSSVAAIEANVSNATAEASAPMTNGHVSGVWSGYAHTANNGSAAFCSGSLAVGDGKGWLYGLWLDGMDTASGVGIVLNDDVGPNLGMNIGIDTSRVASFVTAAVKLGNNHPIGWNASGGTFRSALNVTTGNVLEVGNTNLALKLKAAGGTLLLQGIATSTSATAGARTLPASPAGFLNFSTDDGTTVYKIPYYAE